MKWARSITQKEKYFTKPSVYICSMNGYFPQKRQIEKLFDCADDFVHVCLFQLEPYSGLILQPDPQAGSLTCDVYISYRGRCLQISPFGCIGDSVISLAL